MCFSGTVCQEERGTPRTPWPWGVCLEQSTICFWRFWWSVTGRSWGHVFFLGVLPTASGHRMGYSLVRNPFFFFSKLIVFIFNWGIIALQYCVDFCQIPTWISHKYLCPLPLEPPSHHKPQPTPPGAKFSMRPEVVFPLLRCWSPLSSQDYGLWLLWNFGLFVLVFARLFSAISTAQLEKIIYKTYLLIVCLVSSRDRCYWCPIHICTLLF